jgi:hypothetical protein
VRRTIKLRPATRPLRPSYPGARRIVARPATLSGSQRTAAGIGSTVWSVVGTAGAAASAYHGYRRHGTVGAAIGWGLLGAIFPIFTIPVAFAQGFGKRK